MGTAASMGSSLVTETDGRVTDSRTEIDNRAPDSAEGSNDTIAAIITAISGQQGPGGVAIVRLSGATAVNIAAKVFRPARRMSAQRKAGEHATWHPESHRVEYGRAVDPSDGAVIDEVLVIPMLGRRSYTAEDVVEVHCHGGEVCSRRVLQACLEAGARLANAGEFSLRAFLNGRLDLAQAESVAALVEARSREAADSALAAVQGGLSSFVADLRTECIDLLVEMEARLDFDEELPPLDTTWLVTRIDTMSEQLQEALATAKRGRLLQTGMTIAIVGRPNVGKSSLLNAWTRSDRAIVTDIAGTTRDVVEARIVMRGIPVNLLDTAGIRQTDETVEAIGVARSEAAAQGADVVLMVISAPDGWLDEDSAVLERLWRGQREHQRLAERGAAGVLAGPMANAANREEAEEDVIGPTASLLSAPAILLINKTDAVTSASVALPQLAEVVFQRQVATSALTRAGLSDVEEAILELIGAGEALSDGKQWTVNQRQAEQLVRAGEALQRVRSSIQGGLPIDFWTVDVRDAAMALGQIRGEDVSEEVLSNIFSRFCIGK
eukprot:TRINITY_DN39564_c0_g1_i1.p1 TRINITY_DN39564_c0_g1~~TRINITY_DN39564_c0_g1_i1.p1  ORF type:complete len:604 (-),score=115.69 TRINITY_DN39564_c0_g1_i1:68-1723(-)